MRIISVMNYINYIILLNILKEIKELLIYLSIILFYTNILYVFNHNKQKQLILSNKQFKILFISKLDHFQNCMSKLKMSQHYFICLFNIHILTI